MSREPDNRIFHVPVHGPWACYGAQLPMHHGTVDVVNKIAHPLALDVPRVDNYPNTSSKTEAARLRKRRGEAVNAAIKEAIESAESDHLINGDLALDVEWCFEEGGKWQPHVQFVSPVDVHVPTAKMGAGGVMGWVQDDKDSPISWLDTNKINLNVTRVANAVAPSRHPGDPAEQIASALEVMSVVVSDPTTKLSGWINEVYAPFFQFQASKSQVTIDPSSFDPAIFPKQYFDMLLAGKRGPHIVLFCVIWGLKLKITFQKYPYPIYIQFNNNETNVPHHRIPSQQPPLRNTNAALWLRANQYCRQRANVQARCYDACGQEIKADQFSSIAITEDNPKLTAGHIQKTVDTMKHMSKEQVQQNHILMQTASAIFFGNQKMQKSSFVSYMVSGCTGVEKRDKLIDELFTGLDKADKKIRLAVAEILTALASVCNEKTTVVEQKTIACNMATWANLLLSPLMGEQFLDVALRALRGSCYDELFCANGERKQLVRADDFNSNAIEGYTPIGITPCVRLQSAIDLSEGVSSNDMLQRMFDETPRIATFQQVMAAINHISKHMTLPGRPSKLHSGATASSGSKRPRT